jgi:hypothetical protein
MAHLHEVRDTDKHFVIDPITRTITNGNADKNKLMQGDHNSEIFTFEIPKTVESHSMDLCNRVEIHYNNISADKANQSKDYYTVKDMKVDEDETDKLVFSWPVSGNATKYNGVLSFRIRFGCVDENGVWSYKWHTDVFSGITISAGFDNTEAVIEEYADAIAAWEVEQDAIEARITALERSGGGSAATIGTANLLAANWVGSGNLYSQVVSIEGVTENSQVDLTPSVEQLVVFYEKDLTFVTENEGGTVTVYAIGQRPENDYIIQVTITEVIA